MKIEYLYAAAIVSNLAASEPFYAKLLGRAPDDRPMPNLIQWRGYGIAGIQLFEDKKKAGHSTMTIVIADLAATKSVLERAGIPVGDVREGDFGKIAQLRDPDGNNVTLAEPPRKGA